VSPLLPLLASGRRMAIGMATAALIVVAPMTPAADAAGTYINQVCGGIGDANISDAYGGWAQFNSGAFGEGTLNVNQCNWGGMHTDMTPIGSNTVPVQTGLGWRFTAPANTYISGTALSLGGWVDGYDGNNRGILTVDGSTSGRIVLHTSADPVVWPQPLAVNQGGMHDNMLQVTLWCDGPTGHAACGSPWSTGWMSIFAPRVYLNDDNAPTAGATSGSLMTDAQLKGTETLSFSASDSGGGISRFRLYVDNNLVQDYGLFGGGCDPAGSENGTWMFTAPKPCPSTANATAAFNTTSLTDGPHTIVAKVVDVGQREATLYSTTKVAVNHPPVSTAAPTWVDPAATSAPHVEDTLTAKVGTWTGPSLTYATAWQECDANGANCAQVPGRAGLTYSVTAADAGHRVRFVQTASNVAGSVSAYSPLSGIVPTASVTSGGAGGAGVNGASVPHTFMGQIAGEAQGVPCPKDTAKLTLQKIGGGVKKLASGHAGTATVLLTCAENGKAITSAHLDVTTKINGQPVASQITTGGAGLATLELAKGPGRTVTIGYRMYADDPIARATAVLKVTVPAKVSLKASPRSLRNGRPVILTGTLTGGYVPKRGVILAVQWKDGQHWRTFAQIRTKGTNGKFRYVYRFTRTNQSVRYHLRVAVIKGQLDYPFLATSSKPVSVLVNP
jgi:hypothetical protein